MLVIVSSNYDTGAQELRARWGNQCARILSCEDLATAGWAFSPGSRDSVAVIGGQVIRSSEITGILCRRPAIFAEELLHTAPDDRAYVAAEMNAFLLAWLSAQRCPVLNRPVAPSLSGPNWRPEQWIHAAARLGIPVRPYTRSAPARFDAVAADESIEVTVVGSRCIGGRDGVHAPQARELARAAGVELLSVLFDADGRFTSARLFPSLMSPEVADAVRDYFGSAQ